MISGPNRILIILLSTFFVAGILEFMLYGPNQSSSIVAFVHAFLIAVLCFTWCKSHVTHNNIVAPTGSAALVGFVAPIGVPIYFFRAFGVKEGCIKTLKAVGFAIVLLLTYALGALIGEKL